MKEANNGANEKMETPAAIGAIGPSGPGPCPAGVPLNLCPFDEPMLAAFGEFDEQAKAIEAQRMGALRLFMRQQGLQGEWRISDDRKGLVRGRPA